MTPPPAECGATSAQQHAAAEAHVLVAARRLCWAINNLETQIRAGKAETLLKTAYEARSQCQADLEWAVRQLALPAIRIGAGG